MCYAQSPYRYFPINKLKYIMRNSFNHCLQAFPLTLWMAQGYLFRPCCEYNKGLRQTHHSVTRGHLVQHTISNITTILTHIQIYIYIQYIYEEKTKTAGLLKTSTLSLSGMMLVAVETMRHKGTKCGGVIHSALMVRDWDDKCYTCVHMYVLWMWEISGMRSTVQYIVSED